MNATVSAKRRRSYPRRFDWDEARRLHERGFSYGRIAERFGVTYSAVRRVIDADFGDRMKRASDENQRSGKCVDCGAECSRARGKRRLQPPRCQTCAALAQRTRFHYDEAGNITDARCGKCRAYKPPAAFPHDRRRSHGIAGRCRACASQDRTDYRHRHRMRDRAAARERYRQRGKVGAADCGLDLTCTGCGGNYGNLHRAGCPRRRELKAS